jgi:C1A family cysteine protease
MKTIFLLFVTSLLFSCKKNTQEVFKELPGTGALNKLSSAPLIVSSQYYASMKYVPGTPPKKPRDPKDSSYIPVDTSIVLPAALPAQFMIKSPPVYDQGTEGSCVAFSSSYSRWINNYQETGDTTFFSPEFLYNLMIKRYVMMYGNWDCLQGSFITDALDLMYTVGICSWKKMPYSSVNGCSMTPDSLQLSEAAKYKTKGYSQLYTADRTAIKTLLSQNRAVMFSIAIDQQFYGLGPGAIWQKYLGGIIAGHMITACGYDDFRKAYRVINSWGTNWGDYGYGWIDYDFLPKAAFEYSYTLN